MYVLPKDGPFLLKHLVRKFPKYVINNIIIDRWCYLYYYCYYKYYFVVNNDYDDGVVFFSASFLPAFLPPPPPPPPPLLLLLLLLLILQLRYSVCTKSKMSAFHLHFKNTLCPYLASRTIWIAYWV